MNWSDLRFDWTQLRAFLATAEEGSLSAAARALGLTQPTLGRQVAALEDSLGIALFERVGRGLVLTPSGRELLPHARVMGEAAARVSLVAAGQALDACQEHDARREEDRQHDADRRVLLDAAPAHDRDQKRPAGWRAHVSKCAL